MNEQEKRLFKKAKYELINETIEEEGNPEFLSIPTIGGQVRAAGGGESKRIAGEKSPRRSPEFSDYYNTESPKRNPEGYFDESDPFRQKSYLTGMH